MARYFPWKNRLPIRLALAAGIAVSVVAALLWAAVRQPPSFYHQALVGEAAATRRASQEMGGLATALVNQARKPGRWRGLFTTTQINGWLAVDLANHQRQLLADGVRDPRVAINGDRLQVGFRWHARGIETVGSVELGVSLIEPNVIACRLYAARAGSLPVPREGVVQEISLLASRAEIALYWTQTDGDPVAVITLLSGDPSDDQQIWLEDLQLRDGQVHLAGKTRRTNQLTDAVESNASQAAPPQRDAENSNRQLR